MERQPPRATSNAINLYVRTYCRHSLLSKSLSFGMDSTYGCAIAILRGILRAELARIT